jgi:hypothetical protein
MKKNIKILLFICAFILLSAKTCNEKPDKKAGSEGEAALDTFRLIKSEFESEALSETTLRAFESKAMQNLNEFTDYLLIYSDPSLDTDFRQQAGKMILSLFISDTVTLKLHDPSGKKVQITTLAHLLKDLRANSAKTYDLIADSIVISSPLARVGRLNYKGIIQFNQKIHLISLNDSMYERSIRMNMEIFAIRIKKSFGTDTMKIWQLYLGGIN